MELTVGTIYEGKVKSLTKFGAFVLLPDGATGMVHISEVAYTFVSDIHDYLTEGQDVKVMVIGLENGKINLSIKRTLPQPRRDAPRQSRPDRGERTDRPDRGDRGERSDRSDRPRQQSRPAQNPGAGAPGQPRSFDDMLKQFMTDSNSKMSSSRLYADHKTKTRKR